MLTSITFWLSCSFAVACAPGETPPPGPPWLLSYRAARRDALLHGRPVFVYFTKTY